MCFTGMYIWILGQWLPSFKVLDGWNITTVFPIHEGDMRELECDYLWIGGSHFNIEQWANTNFKVEITFYQIYYTGQ